MCETEGGEGECSHAFVGVEGGGEELEKNGVGEKVWGLSYAEVEGGEEDCPEHRLQALEVVRSESLGQLSRNGAGSKSVEGVSDCETLLGVWVEELEDNCLVLF